MNDRRIERRTVTAKTDFGVVEVSVYVNADKKLLTANETKAINNHLADAAMHAVASAPYSNIPLNRVKVS